MFFPVVFRSARAAGAALLIGVVVVQLGAQAPEPLFSQVSESSIPSGASTSDPRPFYVRSRTTVLQVPTLQRALAAPAASSFTLNLFDDAIFNVTFERAEDSGHGQHSWVGHITERPFSTVILTLSGDIVTGKIVDGATVFEIGSLGGGLHRIDELDATTMPKMRDGVLPVPSAAGVEEAPSSGDVATPAAVTGVDILVYYSGGVRAQAGGPAQATAMAARFIAEANTAFARSGVNGQVRLVGALEVPAPDGASDETLIDVLRTNPAVQSQRSAAGADLVALMVTHLAWPDPNFIRCGLAYIGPASEYGFSVLATRSECDAMYAFTHEIGHNLGAQHATEDGVITEPEYPVYARGYKAPNHSFRTVMAYECSSAPECPPILNFSNPNVVAPPPIPGGQPTGTPAQHNARRLNELFAGVASYRAARVPPSAPQNLQASVNGSTVGLSWLAPSGGGAPGDYLLEAGTGPGLSNLIAGVPIPETSLSVPGVPPGGYFIRVRARNAGGVSSPSNEVSFGVGCTFPSAPQNPTFTKAGLNLSVAWTPPAVGNPVAYVLQAGSAPGASNLVNASVGGVSTVGGAVPAGTYFVRILAANACGIGPASGELAIAVP